jgi:hypothetical protein
MHIASIAVGRARDAAAENICGGKHPKPRILLPRLCEIEKRLPYDFHKIQRY